MIIEIDNLRLKGFVGVYDHEREHPQDIVISVRFSFNAEAAVKNDDITQAVDYEKLANDIRDLLEQNSFRLLETLAARVLEIVSADTRVESAEVKISKPRAIPAANNVSVTTRFERTGVPGK